MLPPQEAAPCRKPCAACAETPIKTRFRLADRRAAWRGSTVARRLNHLAAACRQDGITVIWTRHVVRPDGSNTGLLGEVIPPVAHGIIDDDAPSRLEPSGVSGDGETTCPISICAGASVAVGPR